MTTLTSIISEEVLPASEKLHNLYQEVLSLLNSKKCHVESSLNQSLDVWAENWANEFSVNKQFEKRVLALLSKQSSESAKTLLERINSRNEMLVSQYEALNHYRTPLEITQTLNEVNAKEIELKSKAAKCRALREALFEARYISNLILTNCEQEDFERVQLPSRGKKSWWPKRENVKKKALKSNIEKLNKILNSQQCFNDLLYFGAISNEELHKDLGSVIHVEVQCLSWADLKKIVESYETNNSQYIKLKREIFLNEAGRLRDQLMTEMETVHQLHQNIRRIAMFRDVEDSLKGLLKSAPSLIELLSLDADKKLQIKLKEQFKILKVYEGCIEEIQKVRDVFSKCHLLMEKNRKTSSYAKSSVNPKYIKALLDYKDRSNNLANKVQASIDELTSTDSHWLIEPALVTTNKLRSDFEQSRAELLELSNATEKHFMTLRERAILTSSA